MKKIILLIMVLILFCGCASKNVTISERSSLYDYEGEWIISKLIAPPKVSLTAYGYAMENSHIIGESKGNMDHVQIQSLANLAVSQKIIITMSEN